MSPKRPANPRPKIPTVRKRAAPPPDMDADDAPFGAEPTPDLDEGIALADNGEQDEAERQKIAQEEADCVRRIDMIDESRAFDREAYLQMAKDRAYAAGRTNQPVSINIIGTYIDTWCSLLYARDPDIDVVPEESLTQSVKEEYILFSKSLERVLGQLWKRGKVKPSAKGAVRTALTTYYGMLKCTWQERQGKDPQVSKQLADLQDNLKRVQGTIAAMEADVIDADSDDEKQMLEDQIRGLQGKVEVILSQGMCFDQVDPADLTFSLEAPTIARFREGPWVSHRMYKTWRRAAAEWGITDKDMLEKLKAAATYYPKRAVNVNEAALHQFGEGDVDRYSGGGNTGIQPTGATRTGFLCIEEMWDKDDNLVHTLVRGMKRPPIAAYTPDPTWTEFYPFQMLVMCETDGQRWPDSLNKRSQALQDDANSAMSSFSEHRKRIKPNMLFNAHQLTAAQIKKVVEGAIAEYIALKTVDPDADLRKVFVEKKYPAIDMAAYSLEPILQAFELIWGLQEAMTGTIDTAKTATEAEIQQGGTQSRTGDKRDAVEDWLSDIANQGAEYSLMKLDYATVVDLIGEGAVWPDGLTIDDLEMMATVAIRAGSSGKPNLKAQRESWAQTVGLVAQAIDQIATLRKSNQLDVADCVEELMKETLARTGERIDVSRFVPKVPDMTATVPGAPVGPDGQPTQAPGAVGPDGAPIPADPGAPAEEGAPIPDPQSPTVAA